MFLPTFKTTNLETIHAFKSYPCSFADKFFVFNLILISFSFTFNFRKLLLYLNKFKHFQKKSQINL